MSTQRKLLNLGSPSSVPFEQFLQISFEDNMRCLDQWNLPTLVKTIIVLAVDKLFDRPQRKTSQTPFSSATFERRDGHNNLDSGFQGY